VVNTTEYKGADIVELPYQVRKYMLQKLLLKGQCHQSKKNCSGLSRQEGVIVNGDSEVVFYSSARPRKKYNDIKFTHLQIFTYKYPQLISS
jgi:hypothetical protein